MVTFLRTDAKRFGKFGKGRGKKAKWRNQTGRHNKIREGKKGHQPKVKIGYSTQKESEKVITIKSLKELETSKANTFVLGRVGKKSKIEIAKKAKEKKIKFSNFNPEAFLKKYEKTLKIENKKKEEKKTETKKEESKEKKE